MVTKGLTHFTIQQLKDAGLFKFLCCFGTTRHERANKIHVHDYPFYPASLFKKASSSLHGAGYMTYMFDRNSCGKTSQIEWLFESNLRPSGYFKCSTEFQFPLDTSCKGNLLTRASWSLQAEIVTWRPK